jgi:hypothetical protein
MLLAIVLGLLALLGFGWLLLAGFAQLLRRWR